MRPGALAALASAVNEPLSPTEKSRVGAATAMYSAGWSIDEIASTFGGMLEPLFQLATLVMEANTHVGDGALPMNVDLACSLMDVKREWIAFHDVLIRAVDDAHRARGGAR